MAMDSTRVGVDSAKALSALFSSLTEEDRHVVAGLFASMHTHKVAAGDLLFRPGVSCERFAVVMAGSVRVSLIHGLREKILYRVEPGQLCVHTLTNLLNDRDYQATALAETECQIGWMDAPHFKTLYQTSAPLQRLVVAALSERCFHFVRDIHDLCFRSIASRLAEQLLEQGGRDGLVKASHQALAAQIGTSREVITRQLKQMAEQGLCRVHRGQVAVLDHQGLLHLASE